MSTPREEIDQRLDFMERELADTRARYERCRSEAMRFAEQYRKFSVYTAPSHSQKMALYEAYVTLMVADAGNYS